MIWHILQVIGDIVLPVYLLIEVNRLRRRVRNLERQVDPTGEHYT